MGTDKVIFEEEQWGATRSDVTGSHLTFPPYFFPALFFLYFFPVLFSPVLFFNENEKKKNGEQKMK
jgi:hypothetical protein